MCPWDFLNVFQEIRLLDLNPAIVISFTFTYKDIVQLQKCL